jgi:hypothetical protein
MIKIFEYLEELDCFVISSHYKSLAGTLGLTEWHEAVWIGRYFTLDNDYGEHWFDNWDLRSKIEKEIDLLGIDPSDILIVDPDRFNNGQDGPCHSDEERKQFWTDVLRGLHLSYTVLFAEARHLNEERKLLGNGDFIIDLEDRIEKIKKDLSGIGSIVRQG